MHHHNATTSDIAPPRIPFGRARLPIGPLAPFFIALAIILTWPLANFSDLQLPDHDDALFSVWRLAWIAHQLSAAPAQLFDANIFWPEAGTLAFSDAMLLQGLIGAPLQLIGLHPVAVHNLLLLGAFVSAGLSMAVLVRHFTASIAAQAIAGTIFGFAPYRMAHIGHLELLWTAFLPLALVALYRVMERPTWRRGLALGAAVALQALSSIYYFVFLIIWLAPAALLAPLHIPVSWSRRHAAAGALAAVAAAIVVLPYLLPYASAREHLPARSETEVTRYSATPLDYFRASEGNRIYPVAEAESPDERSLFVGTIPMILAGLAVVFVRTRGVVALAVLSACAFDLSLGVNGVTFPLARDLLPPLSGFRAPARFGVFVLLGVAVLAGLGLAALLRRTHAARARAIAAAILAGLVVEYWSVPVMTRRPPLVPAPVYEWLALQPPTVVLELPVPTPETLWGYETSYQFSSIYHWQRLANGYSGFAPRTYLVMLDAMRRFPSPSSIDFLRARGVQFVLAHEAYLGPERFLQTVSVCKDPKLFDRLEFLGGPEGRQSIVCRIAR